MYKRPQVRSLRPVHSPSTHTIVQIIFSFWSFDLGEGIMRIEITLIGCVSFSIQVFQYF